MLTKRGTDYTYYYLPSGSTDIYLFIYMNSSNTTILKFGGIEALHTPLVFCFDRGEEALRRERKQAESDVGILYLCCV